MDSQEEAQELTERVREAVDREVEANQINNERVKDIPFETRNTTI